MPFPAYTYLAFHAKPASRGRKITGPWTLCEHRPFLPETSVLVRLIAPNPTWRQSRRQPRRRGSSCTGYSGAGATRWYSSILIGSESVYVGWREYESDANGGAVSCCSRVNSADRRKGCGATSARRRSGPTSVSAALLRRQLEASSEGKVESSFERGLGIAAAVCGRRGTACSRRTVIP